MKEVTPPCRTISTSEIDVFREKISELKLEPNLKLFKDPSLVKTIRLIGMDVFHSLIEKIQGEVTNPSIGISVLDIPQCNLISQEDDTFLGIVISLSIIWNLITPSMDSENLTPFTVYTASTDNGKKLDAANLAQNVPEAKLGFHNDGLIDASSILVPNIIALYNILIAYNKPGKFHWVPFMHWNEMKKFSNEFGINKNYKFKIVQNVYSKSNNELNIHGPSEITAPIFSQKINGDLLMFMNGEIAADENGIAVKEELVHSLKNSINRNPFRYSVEQKARRLILLGNTLGCHARDIFEDPIDDSKLTRAFIRSVDINGVTISA